MYKITNQPLRKDDGVNLITVETNQAGNPTPHETRSAYPVNYNHVENLMNWAIYRKAQEEIQYPPQEIPCLAYDFGPCLVLTN